ncbi:MAG: Gfo/Idh/MocA family oxidoreductase [Verrucomicrobia bacterium]|nr:Gfo/Idh/MocA family oxidoreductase [Verrucomicrobiota bacterium]
MRTIRWGILGCGDVCEVKSGPGFQNARNSTLVAVMRRNQLAAEDFAKRHGVPRWYTNAEDLISDPEVDAVYIATPPGEHLRLTKMVAETGKPVYVEKPMARTYAECVEMNDFCHDRGVPLFVAYYRRALHRFVAIKKALDRGAIGQPITATMILKRKAGEVAGKLPWRVIPELSGGGYLWDVGSHALDIMDFLLGPIVKVSGHAANFSGLYSVEDTVAGAFVFANGLHATGLWSFCSGVHEDAIEITGTKAKMQFSLFGADHPLIDGQDLFTFFGEEPSVMPRAVQQPLIQTIVDQLNGEGVCPSTGANGARCNLVLEKLIGKSLDIALPNSSAQSWSPVNSSPV